MYITNTFINDWGIIDIQQKDYLVRKNPKIDTCMICKLTVMHRQVTS